MILLRRLRDYGLADVRGDVIAGLTVAVLFVPQSMAHGLLAGVPPVVGLYTAIVPALLYAWIGASRHMAVGPVAIVSLLVAGGLEPLAEPMGPRYVELAVTLSLMTGAAWLVLGFVRAGLLVNFISHPAIVGFNAAAALLTIASQIRSLLGIPRLAGVSAENPWPILWHMDAAEPKTAALGLGAILLLIVLGRWWAKAPGPLLACAIGALLAWSLDLGAAGVALVGTIPQGLPAFAVPMPSMATIRDLAPTAFTIVIVGYASSITVIKALAARERERIEPNHELWAMGACNVAGAMFGCIPSSGGLGRSTVAAQAGARTQLACFLASLLVLGALLWLGPVFRHLPLAVLAAIIAMSAISLIDIRAAVAIGRTKKADAATLIATFAVTLGLGLIEGLAAGLLLALVLFVWRTASPHSAELGRIPGTVVYRNVARFDVETCPQVGILRVDAPLYYANARYLEDRIDTMFQQRPNMQLLVLECSAVNDLDATAVQTLYQTLAILRARGNDLHIVGAIGPVRDILRRSGLAAALGEDNMHRTILEAAPALMSKISRAYCQHECTVFAFPDCTLIPRTRLATRESERARFSPQI